MLVHEGRKPIEIGALQRFATDAGVSTTACRCARARRRTAGRVAVIGAGPAGLACAGELAARGYAVTVYDERDGARRARPLRDRAVPPAAASRCPTRRGCSSSSASSSARHARRRRRGCASSRPRPTPSSSRVGMGADVDVPYDGDDLDGVWESLPVHRGAQGRRPRPRRAPRRRHRRRQHRDRRRASRRSASARDVSLLALPPHRARDAGVRARGRASPRRRASRSASSPSPVALRRHTAASRASRARRCSSASRTRAAAAGPSPSPAASSSSPSTRS